MTINFESANGASSVEDVANYIKFARTKGQADAVSVQSIKNVTGWPMGWIGEAFDLINGEGVYSPDVDEAYDPYGD